MPTEVAVTIPGWLRVRRGTSSLDSNADACTDSGQMNAVAGPSLGRMAAFGTDKILWTKTFTRGRHDARTAMFRSARDGRILRLP